jgi:deazaflavin-dependent oxidoreductase (nitroreductase family)
VTDRNRAVIEEFRASGGRVGGALSDTPLLLLGTTGARSGRRRTTPLAYRRVDGRLYVIASSGGRPTHPGWYFNLLAHPDVTVELDEERFAATATVLGGAERDRVFAVIAAGSPDAARHQANAGRTIPVIALDPRSTGNYAC